LNNRGFVGAAVNAHRWVKRGGHEADFVGLPVGDAVGVFVVIRLHQYGLVNLVTNADVAANAVYNILKNLFGPSALTKAHYSAGHPVRAQMDRFDYSDVIFGVVVAQQGATTGEAACAHGGGGAVQNLDAPPALAREFGRKCQGDGAGLYISGAALYQKPAL